MISPAICSFVFPSVLLIPNNRAATISGSEEDATGAGVDVDGGEKLDGEVISFDAFSNSRFAKATDLAISGSFCGPHRKTTTNMTAMLIASNPTVAKFASHVKVFR